MTSLFTPNLMLSWVWQPIGSPLHIGLGAAVLIALAIFAYSRTLGSRPLAHITLLVMRIAMIAALAVILMGPSVIPPQMERSVRRKLRILLDTSESMREQDQAGMSRMAFAQQKLLTQQRLLTFQKDFDVELSGFDEIVKPLPASTLQQSGDELATGRATHLAECLRSALTASKSHDAETVFLVISDGHDSQDEPVQSAAMLAGNLNIPIHTVALGGESHTTDLAVLAVPMQEYLLPGEPGAILVKVYQSGAVGASTTLTVKQGSEEQSVPITFNTERSVEVQLPVLQAEPGQYEYSVSLSPIDGEAEETNNSQIVFCDVQRQRIRVLMLEGQPFWDSKFLAQALRKDERIEVTQITQLSSSKRETIVTRAEKAAPNIPANAEEWAKYDIVILGQALENVLSPAEVSQLVEFVSDRGGHVIFARGMAYDRTQPEGEAVGKAIEILEPVVFAAGQLDATSLSLTSTGRSSQWFSPTKMGTSVEEAFARLPGFQLTPNIEREKAATIVLARASSAAAADIDQNGQPAIVQMQYGRGTVVGILGDGLWQWSLLPPENQDLAFFYDAFWTNLIRWLALGGDFRPGEQVALQLSRKSVRLGDAMTVDVVYKHTPAAGANPSLRVLGPGVEPRDVALHPVAGRETRFRAELTPETVGVYQLNVQTPGMQPATLDGKLNVYDVNIERLATSANPLALRMLSEHSGGEFIEPDGIDSLLTKIQQQTTALAVTPQPVYIWDRMAVLISFLIWTGAEWIMRRWAGLI